jgi:hypothetical protein
MKSGLQLLEASAEFAIPRAPKAEFGFVLLIIKLSKSFQLVDLGITALDFGA